MSKTIEIPDELYEQIKGQLCDGGASEVASLADFVGQKLFIRTVTWHWVGKVEAVNGTLIELSGASVVFQSGKLDSAVKHGTLSESEFVGRGWVNASAVADIIPWAHALPKASQ
jgi:hypothetical protein